jgi:hypothetical protein
MVRVVLSDISVLLVRNVRFSETLIITVLKSATRKRLVKTEDFMCAAVTVVFGVCNSARLLQLLVVAISKWSMDQIPNTKPRPETL